MKVTEQLQKMGQSLWLDNITRDLINSGTLAHYINDFSITGLTSNPTIFEKAISTTDLYDEEIRSHSQKVILNEDVFFQLALNDLGQAAKLFKPVHDETDGLDGWVSLEVSPLLVDDAEGTIKAAVELYSQAEFANLLIKIPGTEAGIRAIEETIYSGVPVNVTLLFSKQQYVAAAEAYMRGIERRIAEGMSPHISCVASLFVSRWDVAIKDKVNTDLQNKLGIAIAQDCYKAYQELMVSTRWQTLIEEGAQGQRLLWASTGTKDPHAPATLYIDALAAPNTINTIPEKTLHAFAEHGQIASELDADASDVESLLDAFSKEGIDLDDLASQLQKQGAESFAQSWRTLLDCIHAKREVSTNS